MTARTRALWTAALWTVPSVAGACPVCYDPREPSSAAFLAGTALLSLLPLAAIGGIVYYFWRAARSADPGDPPA